MKISIITPCLNRKGFIEEAIQSVLMQDVGDIEHWIVDGGSTDGTLEVLAKYPHLKVVSERDAGVYDALNKGISRASGDLVGFLNTDDQYVPGVFAMVEKMLARSSSLVFSGGSQIYQRTGSGVDVEMHRYVNPERYRLGVRSATLGIPNINARFYRKSVFETVGLFNISYRLAADREFLLRAALVDTPDITTDRLIYRYRWHADSLTMNAGNDSLMAAVREGILISDIYSDLKFTRPAEKRLLVGWRRELQATAFMVHAMQRRPVAALELAQNAMRENPGWIVDLLRCGSLAVGRRSRTALRKFLAHRKDASGQGGLILRAMGL